MQVRLGLGDIRGGRVDRLILGLVQVGRAAKVWLRVGVGNVGGGGVGRLRLGVGGGGGGGVGRGGVGLHCLALLTVVRIITVTEGGGGGGRVGWLAHLQ